MCIYTHCRLPSDNVPRSVPGAYLQEDAFEQFEAGVALLWPTERRQRERVVRVLVLAGIHVLPETSPVYGQLQVRYVTASER